MGMTKDRAKVICRHLYIAQQSLGASAPASATYHVRLGKLQDSLRPDSVSDVVEGEAAALAELQQIFDGLENLNSAQPERNPSTLPSGVIDALEQLAKARVLLAEVLPPIVKSR
jgi:hypothetical protein